MLNFKKGGLFSRKENIEPPEIEPENIAQVLAVWGSPGCGKTTVAVKLAKYGRQKKERGAAFMRLHHAHASLRLSVR